MNIDLKAIVKSHVTLSPANDTAVVTLEKVQDGEWELARKSEYKRDVFAIPQEDVFFEVCFARSGTYYSGYTYDKPKFNLVTKTTKQVVSYPAIASLKKQAEALKAEHFDQYDDSPLEPVYQSGWVYAAKVHVCECVFDIGGVLLKKTLYGNSDWTEHVEYDIVDKLEETIVTYKK
jgi:hypothetical protein